MSSSAKIQRFPWSPCPLAPSMQWASRASSSPSPCLRRPPNPPSSAASSQASPLIPTASVVGRLLFFAIAGRCSCRRHQLPHPHPPLLPDLVMPSPSSLTSLACPTIIARCVLLVRHLWLIVIFVINAGLPTLSPSRSHLLFLIVKLNARLIVRYLLVLWYLP